MTIYSQAIRYVSVLVSLFYCLPQLAQAQELDVENEQFPGAKRVTIETRGQGKKGFWAEYNLDAKGRATEGRFYFRRQLNMIEQYAFTSHDKLQQERVSKPGKKEQVQIFSYSYQYGSDSSRIIRKVGLTGTDTMYVFRYLEFDQQNRPTKFAKAKGWSRKADEVTELTYTNGQITTYRRTDYGEEGTTIYTFTYQYNTRGDLTKESRTMSPKPPVDSWLDGRSNEVEYDYDYSPKGPWQQQYQLFNNKKILVAKRTFTY